MQLIRAAEHLGVRLPASPPPRALDYQKLLAVEGSPKKSALGVRADGVRYTPQIQSMKESEEPQLSQRTAGTCRGKNTATSTRHDLHMWNLHHQHGDGVAHRVNVL